MSTDLLQTNLLAAAQRLEIQEAQGEKPSLQEVLWTKVANPAEAYLASIARVGWRQLSATQVLDHNGQIWDFKKIAPEALARHHGAQGAVWRSSGVLGSKHLLGAAPCA